MQRTVLKLLLIINNCMHHSLYSWQVLITLLPNEPLYRYGKVYTVRLEFLHSGFTVLDVTDRFDNLFAVAHYNKGAATLFRLKYDYPGLTIKRC